MPARRTHRVATAVLVVLATVVVFVAVYAVWIRDQVLDGPAWADTSTEVVRDGTVRQALATTLADRLTEEAAVRAELAAPLLGGGVDASDPGGDGARALHQQIERTAYVALGSAELQRLWRAANLQAQRELVRILDGDGDTVEARDGRVTLDLRELVRRLGERAGLRESLVDLLPAGATRIEVLRSSDVTVAQNSVSVARTLATVLPLLALALWIAALALARGRRRVVLVELALGLLLAGGAVLLSRILAGDAVVVALVDDASYRDAADQVWAIGTSFLRAAGLLLLAAGALLLAGTAVAGFLGREQRPARY